MKIHTLVLSFVGALSLAPMGAIASGNSGPSAAVLRATRRAGRATRRVSSAGLEAFGDRASGVSARQLNAIATRPTVSIPTLVRSAAATGAGAGATASYLAAAVVARREQQGHASAPHGSPGTALVRTAAHRAPAAIPGASALVGRAAGLAAKQFDEASTAATHGGGAAHAAAGTATSAALTYAVYQLTVGPAVRVLKPAAKAATRAGVRALRRR